MESGNLSNYRRKREDTNKKRGIIMEGLAFIWILFVYIGLPVAVVLLLIWIYKIKSNSETQVKQNQKIIQLLDERYK